MPLSVICGLVGTILVDPSQISLPFIAQTLESLMPAAYRFVPGQIGVQPVQESQIAVLGVQDTQKPNTP